MKTRNLSTQIETVKQDGGCCGSGVETSSIVDQQCCEQPIDGTSCCDTNETKEVNIQKTGCC